MEQVIEETPMYTEDLSMVWEHPATESPFRIFVRNKYYENKDERHYHNEECLEFQEYIKENKWFLRKLYKEG